MIKNAMVKNAMVKNAMVVNAMDKKYWYNFLYEIENLQMFALGKHFDEEHSLENNTGESSSKSLVKDSSSKSLVKDSSYGNRGTFLRKIQWKLFKMIDVTRRSPVFSYDVKQNMDSYHIYLLVDILVV